MEQPKSEVLNSMLCFALYTCSREMTRTYRPLLEKLHITYPQYLVFLLLWSHSPRTVKSLGEQLFLDSGTLTPLLKRMEEKGWITRERSRIDERVVNVSVTEAGKALYAEAECIPVELMERIGLNEPEYQLLLSQLHTLLQHLSPVSSED